MQHRHRSLVLNGSGAQGQPSPAADDASSSNSQPTWVAKTDRHLQLINSSVYEKESQARAKAMAESSQQKTRMKDEREKAKLSAFLRTPPAGVAAAKPSNGSGSYELTVEGIRFLVAKDGSKLVKAPGRLNVDMLAASRSRARRRPVLTRSRRHQPPKRDPQGCRRWRRQILQKQNRKPLPRRHCPGASVRGSSRRHPTTNCSRALQEVRQGQEGRRALQGLLHDG